MLGATDGSLRAVAPDSPYELLAQAPPNRTAVVGCAITADNRRALGLREDGSITVLGVQENTFRTVDAPADFDGKAVNIEARGEIAIVGSSGQATGVYFFDIRGGEWIGSLQTQVIQSGPAVSRDGRLLVTAEMKRKVLKLWDVSQPRHPALRHRLMLHDDMVTRYSFNPDSTSLGIGYQGGEVFVVSLGETLRPTRLTGHRWPVVSVCFSPDGSWMATSEFGPGLVRVHTITPVAASDQLGLPEYVDPGHRAPAAGPAPRGPPGGSKHVGLHAEYRRA